MPGLLDLTQTARTNRSLLPWQERGSLRPSRDQIERETFFTSSFGMRCWVLVFACPWDHTRTSTRNICWEKNGDQKLSFSISFCNPRDMERNVENMSIWLECREENDIFRTWEPRDFFLFLILLWEGE